MSTPPDLAEWQRVYSRVPEDVCAKVHQLIERHATELSVAFYGELLAREDVSRLISADLLQSRLLPSVQRWLLFLFDPANGVSPSPVVALQRHVGEMHARVGVSWDLVAFGFRGFKRCLNAVVLAEPVPDAWKLRALMHVTDLIDLAQAEMMVAQLRKEQATPSSAEANAALELERSRPLLALGEEESRFLQTMLNEASSDALQPIGASPFGQWLAFEAPLLFAESGHLQALEGVQQKLRQLDTDVLPRLKTSLAAQSDAHALFRQVVVALEAIRSQVNTLFDALVATEGHRDALTQLFNRPLLRTLLRREIGLARRKQSTFSVLLVDIDRFRDVNLRYGQASGNRVLQQVANLLATQVRSSDFVFRYGGEEFLLLLVDLDAEQSVAVAEKIRRTVEEAVIDLPNGEAVRLTLSLGVTTYGGQSEIDAVTVLAEHALQQAKGRGSNQVCVI